MDCLAAVDDKIPKGNFHRENSENIGEMFYNAIQIQFFTCLRKMNVS